ncbi:Hypp7470 [Branchiostoma lanceolatum]|uniref:Hypp7470 protein n=1 Tax=Branchiostoma lanceolatum TaxID=7740 RepID=A0A8J9Z0L4_BRALA|nr:Hypp7470 [Branchiostoma lanceolatum]
MPRKTSKSQKKTPQEGREKKHSWFLTASSYNTARRDGVSQDVLLFMSNIEGDLRKFLDGEPLLDGGLVENLHDISTKADQITLPGAAVKPSTTSDEPALDRTTREEVTATDNRFVLKTVKDGGEDTSCCEDGQTGGKEPAEQIKQHRRTEKTIASVATSQERSSPRPDVKDRRNFE